MTLDNKAARDAPVHVDPDLGVLRTMLAADRTLMAWIRTSLSMFTFGYTLYKVLQEVKQLGQLAIHDAAPRNAGVLLTLAGTVALVLGNPGIFRNAPDAASVLRLPTRKAGFDYGVGDGGCGRILVLRHPVQSSLNRGSILARHCWWALS